MKSFRLLKTAMLALSAVALVGSACVADTMTCEQWAEKLAVYKTDVKEGSKGRYGKPMSEAAPIVEAKPAYLEARQVYESFKKTGMDPDDCWQLRQAEWDIRVAIENYEGSVSRMLESAEEVANNNQEFLDRDPANAQKITGFIVDRMNEYYKSAAEVVPADDARLLALKDKVDKINARIAKGTEARIAGIRMKPDVYKGADSAALKAKAKAIVLKASPGAQILRVNITKPSWERESVIEHTDTTKTALRHRVTDGIYAQVAAKSGTQVTLYTLFLNKDKIAGKQGALTGHVAFKDKMLEQNVNK